MKKIGFKSSTLISAISPILSLPPVLSYIEDSAPDSNPVQIPHQLLGHKSLASITNRSQ